MTFRGVGPCSVRVTKCGEVLQCVITDKCDWVVL